MVVDDVIDEEGVVELEAFGGVEWGWDCGWKFDGLKGYPDVF